MSRPKPLGHMYTQPEARRIDLELNLTKQQLAVKAENEQRLNDRLRELSEAALLHAANIERSNLELAVWRSKSKGGNKWLVPFLIGGMVGSILVFLFCLWAFRNGL